MPKFEYGRNSVALEVATKQIKLYKDSLALCPKVMEVVRKFDGKVANKRLETALMEINKGLCCRKSRYADVWEIVFYTSDRMVSIKQKSWDGKHENNVAYYIKDSKDYIARDIFRNLDGAFVNEDGRWNADNINKQIEAHMRSLETNISKYEAELKSVDRLEAERKQIKAEIDAFNNEVSWIGNEYFGLRI